MNHASSSPGICPASLNTTPVARALDDLLGSVKDLPQEVRESIEKSLSRKPGYLQIRIPPHQITFGRFANRHRDAFSDPDFRSLKQEIEAAGGNKVAIVVRPVSGPDAPNLMNAGIFYEVVAGHRRQRACQELNLDVCVIVMPDLSDEEVVRLMHAENVARKSLSPYEVGMMYATWLEEKVYATQAELAKQNNLLESEVSRALGVARLPTVIHDLFVSPRDLQYKDADEIRGLLKANEAAVLEAARLLADREGKASRRRVLAELRSAVQEGPVGSANLPRFASLKVADKDVAHVRWDAKGGPTIQIKQSLDEGTKVRLHELLAKFFAKELGGRRTRSA